MAPVLCFDIETVPDVTGMRRLLAVASPGDPAIEAAQMDDEAVAETFFARRRDKTGSDFLPLHQHRVVAIACLMRSDDGLFVRCLGRPEDSEDKLIALFFRQIERYTPQLVSWNGSGFDLPVLNYRALVHGVAAARFWDMGDADREFRYNNYISRYHARHLDLMDLLAMYSPRASVPLDELARLCGFPGKLGMDGSQVWGAWQAGQHEQIRQYCETDVANTWLMYCRFQRLRGQWDDARYDTEIELLRDTIAADGARHWRQFLQGWTS